MPPTHVVITPARDEAGNLPALIDTMTAQTVRPALWLIVDDGSTDGTAALVDEAARAHPFIRRLPSRLPGDRSLGSKVARLFLEGVEAVETPWDFLSKIDADLILPPDYFEALFARFDANPDLGIAGGGCYEQRGEGLWYEPVPEDHTRGALKTYRRAAWDAFGGIRPVHGWDGIDNLLAQMHGFTTRTFPELKAIHRRPTGSARGVLRGRFRTGTFAHFMGYDPLFMAGRCVRRSVERPFVAGAAAMAAGFVWSKLTRAPVFPEPEVVAFLRRKQRRRMGGLLGRLGRGQGD